MRQPVVYILDNNSAISDEIITHISEYLPASRLEKADRYLRTVDRNNCIISYFLLLYGLLENYGIRTIPEIERGLHGKPYFKDADISFNISHCDSGVCCGINDRSLGVDIQDTDIEFEEILDITMSRRERELIERSDAPSEIFARFWSLKESLCKYRGTGINDALNKIDFSEADSNVFSVNGVFFRSEKRGGFWISASSENQVPAFIEGDIKWYIHRFREIYE